MIFQENTRKIDLHKYTVKQVSVRQLGDNYQVIVQTTSCAFTNTFSPTATLAVLSDLDDAGYRYELQPELDIALNKDTKEFRRRIIALKEDADDNPLQLAECKSVHKGTDAPEFELSCANVESDMPSLELSETFLDVLDALDDGEE